MLHFQTHLHSIPFRFHSESYTSTRHNPVSPIAATNTVRALDDSTTTIATKTDATAPNTDATGDEPRSQTPDLSTTTNKASTNQILKLRDRSEDYNH